MVKLNFQQPLFQSLESHDPSEIILICWFGAQETFLINFELHLFKIEIFCNYVKVLLSLLFNLIQLLIHLSEYKY